MVSIQIQLTAFLMHLDDVEQALEALYYFSVQLLVNSQFMCIIIARRSFNEMWNQMKSNVTSSNWAKLA